MQYLRVPKQSNDPENFKFYTRRPSACKRLCAWGLKCEEFQWSVCFLHTPFSHLEHPFEKVTSQMSKQTVRFFSSTFINNLPKYRNIQVFYLKQLEPFALWVHSCSKEMSHQYIKRLASLYTDGMKINKKWILKNKLINPYSATGKKRTCLPIS